MQGLNLRPLPCEGSALPLSSLSGRHLLPRSRRGQANPIKDLARHATPAVGPQTRRLECIRAIQWGRSVANVWQHRRAANPDRDGTK
jgi:hypothetical protein